MGNILLLQSKNHKKQKKQPARIGFGNFCSRILARSNILPTSICNNINNFCNTSNNRNNNILETTNRQHFANCNSKRKLTTRRIKPIFGLAFGFALLPTIMWPQTTIFLILLLFQQKFAWMITPLLSVGIVMFYTNKKLDGIKWSAFVKSVLVSAVICCVVAWSVAALEQPPHSHTWNAIDYALEQTDDNVLQNDWDLGYFIIHKGGTPIQYGGGKQFDFGKGIGITKFDQNNCVTLKSFKDLNVVECS